MKIGIINVMISFVTIVFGLAGCGGGSSSLGGDTTISIVDGNNQTATVNSELPKPLVVLIENSEGQPVAGQTVNFKVISGNGTVFAGAATSDANGIARERWTLGTIAGAQKVEVRAVDSSGVAVVYATFDSIAVAGPPNYVEFVSGGSQAAQQMQSLPLPVKAMVMDAFRNPVPGVLVTFADDKGGMASPQSAISNASGEAATTWTMGLTIGTYVLSATVAGVATNSIVAYAIQAPSTAATSISMVSGNSQSLAQYILLPTSLEVVVADILGNPVSGEQVTFSAPDSGSSYNNPVSVTTDSTGKAGWTGYFYTAGQHTVDAVVANVGAVKFDVNVTASSHLYDGRYSCNKHSIEIVNGLVSLPNDTTTTKDGGIDESTGALTARIYYGLTISDRVITNLSGQFTIDSLQRATSIGTYRQEYYFSNLPDETGAWTCERQ